MATLSESRPRVYCCLEGSTYFDFFKYLQTSEGQIVKTKIEGEKTYYNISHMLRPFDGVGIEAVESEFGITLPSDIKTFYQKWSGGTLVYRQVFRLMSPQEIIAVSKEIREVRNELSLPWRLIRFCDMEDSNYFALRLNPKASHEWQVTFAEIGYLDDDLQRRVGDDVVTDWSFADWLDRLDPKQAYFSGIRSAHSVRARAAYDRRRPVTGRRHRVGL